MCKGVKRSFDGHYGSPTCFWAPMHHTSNLSLPGEPYSAYTCIHVVVDNSVRKTRLDTRLPKSRLGGQGPYLRSLVDHLGSSSGVNKIKS